MNNDYVERIRKFKKMSGWSAMKIAVAIGLHVGTVNSWLAGTHTPCDMAKEKIEKFLVSQALAQVEGA